MRVGLGLVDGVGQGQAPHGEPLAAEDDEREAGAGLEHLDRRRLGRGRQLDLVDRPPFAEQRLDGHHHQARADPAALRALDDVDGAVGGLDQLGAVTGVGELADPVRRDRGASGREADRDRLAPFAERVDRHRLAGRGAQLGLGGLELGPELLVHRAERAEPAAQSIAVVLIGHRRSSSGSAAPRYRAA